MSIEAEVKARVSHPDRVRALLRQHAVEQRSVYADTYFDTPERELTRGERELRVREMRTDDSPPVTLLTYKGAPVRKTSGSKPEAETNIGDANVLRTILAALGFEVLIAFEKHCKNYRFTFDHHSVLATLVSVPELQETFLEIESIVDSEHEIEPALTTIRRVLHELGISRDDETTEAYTEAVSARRARP